MIILTDNWTERKTKKGDVYHNFNVSIDLGDAVLYTMGWQLFNGVINPPSFRSGWRFYPMLLSSGMFARQLWDTVNDDKKRPADLRSFDDACAGLVASQMEFARLFPSF